MPVNNPEPLHTSLRGLIPKGRRSQKSSLCQASVPLSCICSLSHLQQSAMQGQAAQRAHLAIHGEEGGGVCQAVHLAVCQQAAPALPHCVGRVVDLGLPGPIVVHIGC